ncbi:TrmH family RNA methyltransferase [Jatrophihabitans sp.]|uniref:TrmH family RNA methyltransferase n=1 Tax=Jatrophihabitans sp. TaxID=1932789 RepID=UPI002C433C4F|nr:RNA methyltransferase [Jatrophihabitans sp.]
MSVPIPVSDPGDPRLADFRDLMQADRESARPVVIAEGVNPVERLARSRYSIRAVLGVPAKLAALAPALAGRDVPVYEVDKWTLSEVVGFRVTRGVLASADRPAPVAVESLIATGNRFVVLESINDYENLGAVFRNGAAFGVDAVLLDPRCADPLYRRSVRVSMGHVFGVGFAVLPEPWPASLDLLRAAGVRLLAMTPRPAATALAQLIPPDRWALLLGAEGPGLSEAALAAADEWVRIPMADGVDSLNVATAGAVALAHLTG